MFNRIVNSFARAVAAAMAGPQPAAPHRFTGQIGNQKLRITVEVDDGVPAVFLMDHREAVRLYRLAADQGHATAQYQVGDCYANGEGVAKDQCEAVKWYRLAADQGHARAQYNLGCCYANGNGVAKDQREAVKWFRLAADRGFGKWFHLLH